MMELLFRLECYECTVLHQRNSEEEDVAYRVLLHSEELIKKHV